MMTTRKTENVFTMKIFNRYRACVQNKLKELFIFWGVVFVLASLLHGCESTIRVTSLYNFPVNESALSDSMRALRNIWDFKLIPYKLKKLPKIGDAIQIDNYLEEPPVRYYTHWISTDASECGPLVKVKGIYYGLIYKKGSNVVKKICTHDKKFCIRGYHVGDRVDSLLVDIPYFRFLTRIYRIDRQWYAEIGKGDKIYEFICSSEEDIDRLFDVEYYTKHTKYAPIYQY